MSSANVELVRSKVGPWACGDFSADDWADPSVEFSIADGPTPGRWSGLRGMAEGFREWLSAWEGFRVEMYDFREIDDERVLTFGRIDGRGKTSGLEIGPTGAKGAGLFHVRGGKVTKYVIYWDRSRAIADLGVADESSPVGN
jgi:hypothetical protein